MKLHSTITLGELAADPLPLSTCWRCKQEFRSAYRGWVCPACLKEGPAIMRENLTQREQQVVALLCDGLSNRAIGEKLGLTEGTVKVYTSRIFSRTSVSSRHELACKIFAAMVKSPAEEHNA